MCVHMYVCMSACMCVYVCECTKKKEKLPIENNFAGEDVEKKEHSYTVGGIAR